METLNCIRCDFRHKDNGNCTAVGGFCTAVTAAHCPMLQKYLDTGLGPDEVTALQKDWSDLCTIVGECGGIDLMLYVLIDKHDAPMDDVQQLASELNHAAQCVAEGYVTWADIRQMLKEYGVETALE